MIKESIIQEPKIINKKWAIQILVMLHTTQKISYKTIKNTLQIPNSTLIIRLNELVKYRYLQKFIYGSVNKPHLTEYQITDFGLNSINIIFPFNN